MKRLALIVALLIGSPALAEDAVDNLIKQLDAQNFLEREKAASKLQELGEKAVPALQKAASEGSLETTVRSIGILKKLMESDNEPTAEAAKSALEVLAKSENAGTARRAKNAIAPKPQPPQPVPNNPFGGGIGGIQIRGNVVIQNNAQRIRVRNVNGVKTMEVTEGQREVKILDDPNKGITVEITEQKNGKKATEKFEAKNADELKKKHPKAYEDYKKYSQGNAARIRIGGAGLPFRRVAPPAIQQRINGNQLEMAGRLLKSLKGHVERMVDDNTIKNADNQSRETLKKDLAEIREELTALEKKLQAAIDADAKEQKAEDAKAKTP